MPTLPPKIKDPFAHKIPKRVYFEIAPKLRYQDVKKGEYIDTKGKIFFIKSGEIEMVAFTGGKQVVIETLFSGDFFGDFCPLDPPLIESKPMSRLNNRLCYLSSEDFWDVINKHPDMNKLFLKYIMERHQQYQYKLHSYSLPAHEKVLYEINLLKKKLKQSFWGKLFNIPLKISHDQLARKTGLNRVTVTRILNQLQKEGLVKLNPDTGEIDLTNLQNR